MLIEEVRDATYENYLLTKNGHFNSKSSKKEREMIARIGEQNILNEVVLRVVDKTLFKLLVMLQQNEFILSSEEFDSLHCLDDCDGPPAELLSEYGWIQKFSKYKHTEEQQVFEITKSSDFVINITTKKSSGKIGKYY